MKTCTRCGETKALDEFHNRKDAKDGKNSHCKTCARVIKRAYLDANREIHRERRRIYYWANRDRERSQGSAYQAANPEKSRIREQRRRARKADNGVYLVTDRDYRRILESPCVACGSTQDIQVDHIIPIARGGRHAVGNLQALCGSCNASKWAYLPIVWRTRHRASGTPHAQGGRP